MAMRSQSTRSTRSTSCALVNIVLSVALFAAMSVGNLVTAEADPDFSTNTLATTETCPDRFSDIKVPQNGKLCQVFATNFPASFPASMVFFVPQTPQSVLAYYQEHQTSLVNVRKVKGRTMMQSDDKSTTVIISADGHGTQVDILVTKAPSNA